MSSGRWHPVMWQQVRGAPSTMNPISSDGFFLFLFSLSPLCLILWVCELLCRIFLSLSGEFHGWMQHSSPQHCSVRKTVFCSFPFPLCLSMVLNFDMVLNMRNRLLYPLLKSCCKWQGHGLLYWESSLELGFTGTFSNIQRQPRFPVFSSWELILQSTFQTPTMSRRGTNN